MTKVRTAVFPVGGLGTRFLPATKAIPKEMLPVVDKPLIQYAVEEAIAAGIESFIFVTGRGKTAIEDHFDHSFELENALKSRGKNADVLILEEGMLPPGSISYTRQQEPLGLGHAVWCARHLIGDDPFAVLLADDFIYGDGPCLKQMIDAYGDLGGNMVAIMPVSDNHIHRYGVIDPGPSVGFVTAVRSVVEKPDQKNAPSNLAIIGRYILHPDVFIHLDKGERGAGGEIQLTDAFNPMIGTMPFYGYQFKGRRYDCGSKAGLLGASIAVALDRDDLKDDVICEIRSLMGDIK